MKNKYPGLKGEPLQDAFLNHVKELDKDGLATSAALQHQDWLEPWDNLPVGQADWTALLSFAQQFYFGGN